MKKCLFCETEIPEASARTRFCSDACSCKDRNNRHRKPIVAYEAIPCKNCGKMFTPKQSNSVACGRPGCKAIHVPVLKYKKCLICGIEITTKFRNKYCSDRCASKTRINEFDDRPCIYCGKMFAPKNSRSQICQDIKCLKNHHITLQKSRRAIETGQEQEISKEVILTKCPRCSIIYQRRYAPAWGGRGMPRIFCNACNQHSYNIQSEIWGSNEVYA